MERFLVRSHFIFISLQETWSSVYTHMHWFVLRLDYHNSFVHYSPDKSNCRHSVQLNGLCKHVPVQNFMLLFLLMNKFPEIKKKKRSLQHSMCMHFLWHKVLGNSTSVFSVIQTICLFKWHPFLQSLIKYFSTAFRHMLHRYFNNSKTCLFIKIKTTFDFDFSSSQQMPNFFIIIQIFHPPRYCACPVPFLILCH